MAGRTLNSPHVIPKYVLEHLGVQLHIIVPDIASIRALYQCSRTLFDHQNFAAKVLGFSELTDHAERGLTDYLRRSVVNSFRGETLALLARVWLYEHRYLMSRVRRVDPGRHGDGISR